MKVMKILAAAVLAGACAFSSFGATSRTVKYLDSYRQLAAVEGQDGLYFIRDNSTAPNGSQEWAVYAWDTPRHAWVLITKQSLLNLPQKYNLDLYLTKMAYNADINSYKQRVNTALAYFSSNCTEIAALKDANGIISSIVANASRDVETLGLEVVDATNRLAVAEALADDATNRVASVEGRTTAVEGRAGDLESRMTAAEGATSTLDSKVDEQAISLRGYTDAQIAENKVDIITNTAVRMRATLQTANAYSDQIGQDTLAAASSDAAAKDTVVLSSAQEAAGTAKTEAIAAAKEYTDGVAAGLLTTEAAAATYQPIGPYLTEHQDISGKADKSFLFKDNMFYNELVYGSIKSIFWNETTGGGIRLENSDTGVKSAFSVNDGGGGGIYGQIYAVKKIDGKSTGTRITITDNGAFYTVTNTYQWTAGDEIAVKKDLSAFQPAGEYLVAADIAGKLDASVAEATYQPKGDYLTEHQDISGKLDATVAAETYQPKGTYIVEGSPLTLPLKLKKGDSLYQLDVVDNGGDDISLSITKIPAND